MSDWKKEALEAMAANRARQEEMWRKANVGKVRLYLVNAPGDPPTFSSKYQADLRNVIAALRTNKIDADASFMTMDSADATGGYVGEIAVLASAFGPVPTGILCAWLQSKAGRKVRLKDGDIEVEARTVQEARELLNMAVEQRAKHQEKGEP